MIITWPHDVNERHELVRVFPGRDEALQDQDLEVGEHVAVLASHHLEMNEKHLKLSV